MTRAGDNDMELTKQQQQYIRRIMLARMKILSRNGFYGLLLMHMKFAIDGSVKTAATDGERIYFAPEFLDDISDSELMFILEHEILHVVLRHVESTADRDPQGFNIACDIVVNSNILFSAGGDRASITLAKYGESMHMTPNGDEGCRYTAEEVYEMLKQKGRGSRGGKGFPGGAAGGRTVDDHSRWGTIPADELRAVWDQRIKDAYEAAKKGRGTLSAGIEHMLRELTRPKTDWRAILNDFVQEEIVDYSFAPPDRRFSDSPFLLPDFNETDETIRNVLFMIDTSASMTDRKVAQAYSEIKGAIDQYNGRLAGWLGFFDAEVVPPVPFSSESEFRMIKPKGGGGTSFHAVFDYIAEEMSGMEISSIVILTDGYAPFPPPEATMGIPVLWMINNDHITPPWGRAAVL